MKIKEECQHYSQGMTVKELKELIKDWPEEDPYGESNEVWIETGKMLSSPVIEAAPLNYRRNITKEWADLELISTAFRGIL